MAVAANKESEKELSQQQPEVSEEARPQGGDRSSPETGQLDQRQLSPSEPQTAVSEEKFRLLTAEGLLVADETPVVIAAMIAVAAVAAETAVAVRDAATAAICWNENVFRYCCRWRPHTCHVSNNQQQESLSLFCE